MVQPATPQASRGPRARRAASEHNARTAGRTPDGTGRARRMRTRLQTGCRAAETARGKTPERGDRGRTSDLRLHVDADRPEPGEPRNGPVRWRGVRGRMRDLPCWSGAERGMSPPPCRCGAVGKRAWAAAGEDVEDRGSDGLRPTRPGLGQHDADQADEGIAGHEEGHHVGYALGCRVEPRARTSSTTHLFDDGTASTAAVHSAVSPAGRLRRRPVARRPGGAAGRTVGQHPAPPCQRDPWTVRSAATRTSRRRPASGSSGLSSRRSSWRSPCR